MKVDFAITYCCQELQLAMIKREWWFQIDTNVGKCSLTDENDELFRLSCPYCNRSMEDVMDISIEGSEFKL